MPLSYSQFVWGFEVFDSGSEQNNKLPFKDDGTTYFATLRAGVYTADELAAEVQYQMREANTANNLNTCDFDYTTRKFTLTGTATSEPPTVFELLWDHATFASTSCAELLGFTKGDGTGTDADETGSDTYVSEAAAGEAPSSADSWAVTEPLAYTSPVTPQAIAGATTPTPGTARLVGTVQNMSDGGTVESVHFTTLRAVQIAFRALAGTDKDKMEDFLDWISLGKRFTWQPDKTTQDGMKLVLANPGMIANAYEWLARPEVGYTTLTFFEQI